ncbi:hypothetical protein [Mycobacterium shimoidei]|uniref:Uncharacterized protein n=1 Tax=Mycobacterium shimoidei TaxID=29313 RepID=A0A1E3TIQ8_MYCSH|nr:hypothetical protein [Mycobacterium shimoidei]MCV7257822.1 hypothetical protein [Mycobacterium shimoidei]ODR14220.1 hypothetical protein BHQ16_07290 [Mycobacterium shimoidei]ORW83884.1 hypothetical protein AWC26_00180 [Mycobacterium shimoidei]SRX91920.1 hypothetical protein MSP7336_00141 [Mycobacterium shimoidei]
MITVIDIESDPTTQAALNAAAFADEPGRWPLPTATTPHQLWLRAVAAGGQGRYGSARKDLTTLLRCAPSGRLASLAHSTQGSFLRQLGWHTLARGWDGRALALADGDPEAGADALIGLAADALGVGRLAASATLLARAEPLAAEAPLRLRVRRAWVAAELAMASDDGATAVRHAESAAELADGLMSARHRVKSDVVLAAALCSAGKLDRARAVGDAALAATGALALVPLRWAVACMLVDLGSATCTAEELVDLRDQCAERVRRAGGVWRT